jgi:hypothetical protein
MTAHDELRALLAPIVQGELIFRPFENGFRIKRVDRYYVDVVRMLYSWRITTTSSWCPMFYDRHWCYNGIGSAAFTAAVFAAAVWDGSDDTEPLGWNKNVQTGVWREPGTPGTWQELAKG